MMTCIFRICGSDLDLDSLLQGCPLPIDRSWRKGEARGIATKKTSETSGVSFLVSSAEMNEYEKQIDDAVKFIDDNEQALSRLSKHTGVDGAVFDFAVEINLDKNPFPSDFIPERLIKAISKIGVSIEISHYPTGDGS